LKIKASDRPDCERILAEKQKWAYNFEDIKRYLIDENMQSNLKHVYKIDDNFTWYFLQTKYRINSKF
jgi:hypothetical protein